jgi:hypothetical protein
MKKLCGSKYILSFVLALSFCSAFLFTETAKAVDGSVIDYYKLNSSSRSASINSSNQVSGGSDFVSGQSGLTGDNALQITYWSASSFSFASSNNKTITDGFSVCFWHKQNSGGNESRLDFSISGVGGGGGGLGPYNAPGFSSPAGTNGCSSATNNWPAWSTIGSTFNDGNWHQICYTANETQTKMYMDNIEFYSCNHLDYPTWGDLTAVNFNYGNWPGAIDNVIVFDKTLNADEVATVYNSVDISLLAFTPAEYCGDTFCQTATENCSTCPIDCGECASNPNSGDSLSLFFFSNPYTFSNQSTAIVRYLYNENIFTSYDHIEIRKISSDWLTSTFIATSTIIDNTGFFTSKLNGNSFFTLTGNASTTGYIYYEVIGHLAAYWSPTLGDVEATTTIPYIVTVNWQPTQIPTVADILAASSTNPFYDDAVMYEAACSEEDWNTPPPEIFGVDVPALNLTVIGCKFKLGFIIAGNKFTTLATDGIYKAGNILKNVFPFNIYTNLNDAWKASSNATVISELAFLSPVNGNLTVQIPTTGTSTATVVLWGKDIFTSSSTLGTINATKTNQLFLAIKTIIKWALWGLFGLWAIKNGKAFIEKMTGGQ